MDKKQIVKQAEDYIKEQFSGEGSGHDWWHIHRVRNLALTLGREENADLFIVELAALLHDIADWKFTGGSTETGGLAAKKWLEEHGVSTEIADEVGTIIATTSFKGSLDEKPMPTIEGRCVRDADRLDSIGAIGVARAFAFGGHVGRPMYDPDIPAVTYIDFQDYQKSIQSPTINHFHEKLLHTVKLMNTESGKKIAHKRHQYMVQFVETFMKEWDGKE